MRKCNKTSIIKERNPRATLGVDSTVSIVVSNHILRDYHAPFFWLSSTRLHSYDSPFYRKVQKQYEVIRGCRCCQSYQLSRAFKEMAHGGEQKGSRLPFLNTSYRKILDFGLESL